jgi:hypothetical protein
LETDLAADLSGVRIHDHRDAHVLARELGAQAFTVGQDIFFRSGQFRPDTVEGRRLTAHEVAHAHQPATPSAGPLRVSEPSSRDEREATSFARAFVSQRPRGRQSPRAAQPWSTPSAGVVHLERTPGSKERATHLRISIRGEEQAEFTLESDGGEPFTATGTARGLEVGVYQVSTKPGAKAMTITGADGSALPQSTQFHISIPSTAKGMHTLLRRATTPIPLTVTGSEPVTEPASGGSGQGSGLGTGRSTGPVTSLDDLPEAVRRILFPPGSTHVPTPEEEVALLRIGLKLLDLSDAELAAFEARTIGTARDLAAFEGGVDAYLDEVRRQHEAAAATERAKIELFGLDKVYDKYRTYRSLLISTTPIPRVPQSVGTSLGAQPTINRVRSELQTELAAHGFASIDAFEKAIDAFIRAVETEAVLVARDQLDRLEHVLVDERARYRDPALGKTLHDELKPARAHFEQARKIRREHAQTVVYTPQEMQEQAYWSGKFQEEQAAGRADVAALQEAHPLLGRRDIPHEELALASPSDTLKILDRYIEDRRKNVKDTRKNLADAPALVFDFPPVMATTFQRLGIASDSFFERIVKDRERDTRVTKTMIKLGIGVFALAAGLVSGGTGAVAVIGGATALGIGAYQAYEEFREYEMRSAAAGAGLLSEDPSLVWVIVSIAAAGLDAAALVKAVRAVAPVAKTFNQTHDVAEFEAALKGLSDLDDSVRATVAKAARLEAEASAAWRSVLRPPAVLRAVLVPGLEEFGRLVYAVFLTARRGILRFELWVKTREAVDLIGDVARLAPEDLRQLKVGYQAAVRDMDQVARHGQALGMTEAEVAETLSQWSVRKGVTVDEIMGEMTAARGSGTTTFRPPTTGSTPRPVIDPGGRGLFGLDAKTLSKLSPEEAARVRELEVHLPRSDEELAELVRLRTKANGAALPEVAGTPEHMLARWQTYKAPPRNGKMTFAEWVAGHPSRMKNTKAGLAAEARYRAALAEESVSSRGAVVKTKAGKPRQVDVLVDAEDGTQDLIQIKSGRESLTTTPRRSGGASSGTQSLSNADALARDAELIAEGNRVTWVFEQMPSGPLVARAREQGVSVIIRVDDAAARARMIELMKRAKMSDDVIASVTFVEGSVDDVVRAVVARLTAPKP